MNAGEYTAVRCAGCKHDVDVSFLEEGLCPACRRRDPDAAFERQGDR